ncbi:MAG: tetratricopeptide repeat protein [Anaerolineales bacterium]|nr:tetratricopeptide repeat protein [Anaerolineales bacterium]
MKKKPRRTNPWRVLALLLLIAAVIYVQRVVVPTVPTPFIPTPTATRSPASILVEAESLYEAGNLEQAEIAYEEAIKINPTEPNFYIDLARLQVFMGHYEAAEESVSNALLLNPDSAVAKAVYGWVLDFRAIDATDDATKVELLNQAYTMVNEAVTIDPNSSVVQALYSEVLIDYDIGRYEEAISAAQRSVQIDPNLMEAHRAMGYVWESTGNYDRAIQSYQAALRIHNSLPILHVAVGNMHQALGDTDAAVDSYLRAVALDPTNPDPLSRIAQAEARVGNYGIASQYAADAVDKDPSNPYLHGNLGRMYYKNGEIQKAVDELLLAVQGGMTEEGVVVAGLNLGESNPNRIIEFYYTYALALAKNNQCNLTSQIFERLLQAYPDDEVVIVNAQEGLYICGEIEATPTPEPVNSETS